eukprot:TRINITY_DN30873_c0_g1_i1.p1 TRINITY_DN30873_c0_g1~~TRINITY_DN30873_c0_g1_i1.p1  ORF type:complete len:406 (+),score=63.12 TRINITY_DN30873_c0_g1_i1:40-1257(+)
MESLDTTAAVTALQEVIPRSGGGMHIYDLARWWSGSGFERVFGDVDVFISTNCPGSFRIHDGLVTHCDVETERFLVAERQRREDSWKSIRQDLLMTNERIQTASRHVKLPNSQFNVRSPPPVGMSSPRRSSVTNMPARIDRPQQQPQQHQHQQHYPSESLIDTAPNVSPSRGSAAISTTADGIRLAASAGISASLSLLSNPEEQIDTALTALQNTIGKQLTHSLIMNWINKTRDPTATLKADIVTKYTPNSEYQGIVNVLKRSSNISVESSSVECGHVEDFIAPGPRLFSTKAEWSPWVLVRIHESIVCPTHYTMGYHPGTHTPPPKNWQVDGFPQGGSDWVVLSSHENDHSYEHPSYNEVVVSFQLQPQTLFFKAFRVTIPQTHTPTKLPLSGFEIYGTIRPLQ